MSRPNKRSLHKAQSITLLTLALGILGVVLVIAGMVSGVLGPGGPAPPEPAGAGETAAIALAPPPRPSGEVPNPARDPETPRPDPQGRAPAGPGPEAVEPEAPTVLVSGPAATVPEGAAEDLLGPALNPGVTPPPPADSESARRAVAPVPPSGPARPSNPAASFAGSDSREMGGLRSLDWILKQDADTYTIQLLAVRKLQGLRALAQGLRLDLELAYFVSHRKGRDWYVLIAGVFPSRQAALAASKGLPRSLRGGPPWIRRMAGVQRAIKPSPG
jgi:DamX protein